MHHVFGVMSKTALPSLDYKDFLLCCLLKVLYTYILDLELILKLIFYKVLGLGRGSFFGIQLSFLP